MGCLVGSMYPQYCSCLGCTHDRRMKAHNEAINNFVSFGAPMVKFQFIGVQHHAAAAGSGLPATPVAQLDPRQKEHLEAAQKLYERLPEIQFDLSTYQQTKTDLLRTRVDLIDAQNELSRAKDRLIHVERQVTRKNDAIVIAALGFGLFGMFLGAAIGAASTTPQPQKEELILFRLPSPTPSLIAA